MLSFDITDRHIRIIRGTESNNKIKVAAAATIDLEEGLIVNGHIKKIPEMATLISEELKKSKMSDKEAVVSISSNLVIFKELHIPKAKGTQLLTMVTNQMQHTMGIADEYSISYSIAGEVTEDGVQALKILATACPSEVVECFRGVFRMLDIQLKSVMVSCNAISRIILSDKKASAKMPMLAVQIDPTFISLNLYENNQLTFSRFASIDPVDYDNSEDYIYEAVNENIYRMFQFQKTRDPENPIQNVVFYGDTSEYIRLTNSLENMDISTSLLGVPNNIGGYENFEFQAYANAIGAMFKSNKESERINLLETDATVGKTEAGASFAVGVLIAAGISAAVIGVICLAIGIGITNTQRKIDDINAEINSEETQAKLAEVDLTQAKIDKIAGFKNLLTSATENYSSLPMLTSEQYLEVENAFVESECNGIEFAYNEGQYQITGYCDDPTIPALTIQYLTELEVFDNIVYTGYTYNQDALKNEETEGSVGFASIKESSLYSFSITAMLKSSAVEDALYGAPDAEETAAETENAEITEGGEG
ncbi:MAG: pilus assembly protein PilM [Oscillospiraceae bacterium]|nr:pilus assembly protein PilM [Oscillospiraceae bacterium]